MSSISLPTYKPADFASGQDVRWCPGCGDYAILAAVKKVLASRDVPKEKYVFVSGIGCSSRFPYYLDTYGIHGIHGRAPAIATGVRCANPDLEVWVITGDGDGLSIGGNHMMHAIRRNMDMKILLFNNRIYGLTKGQYSPTSEQHKKTKSTPMGSIDTPIQPTGFVLGCGATFVARATDVNRGGVNVLPEVLLAAADHRGTAFVEIYQDCNVFNHRAFFYATEKETAKETTVHVKHGKPYIFGNNNDKAIAINRCGAIEVVNVRDVSPDELLVHDEADRCRAFMLTQMRYPEYPEPMGVIYRESQPTYHDLLWAQINEAKEEHGEGTLEDLFSEGSTWVVE
ncbi:MAG: 2-oxoacid:ferredoxin oxidoreductase subunit beta [Phycisphaerales bacterium]|nr:2-oxoacid:ferredoxin oxidoreductase subunit beta [Phycisphaerales bacterium]